MESVVGLPSRLAQCAGHGNLIYNERAKAMKKPNDVLLDRFEGSINRLKLEYDIFFNGGTDLLPQRTHDSVNMELRRLFNVQSLTYAQSFRLNSLADRLSTLNDTWQRNLRLLEEGRKTRGGR